MHDVLTLIDEHGAMDMFADRLIRAAQPGRAGAKICHGLMTNLALHLDAHHKEEAGFVYDDAALPAHLAVDETAASFEGELVELASAWQIYIVRWTPERIAARRAVYAGETVDMLTALKLRLARENQILYSLALATGRIGFH